MNTDRNATTGRQPMRSTQTATIAGTAMRNEIPTMTDQSRSSQRTARRIVAQCITALLLATSAFAQAPILGELRWRATDANGDPISGAKLCSYVAGTSTPKNTYTTSALAVANSNPAIADSGGLFGAVFLATGAYKIEILTAGSDATCATGTTVWSVDNYTGNTVSPTILTKTSSYSVTTADGSDVLILGDATSGALTVTLYTAVGNAGKRVQVRKIDSSVNAVTVDGNTTETIDGALTVTLSAQYDTVVLQSDGTGWQTLTSTVATIPQASEGRCTLTTSVPVTVTDVTAATTLYYTPYKGNRVTLYNGSRWMERTFTERSLSLAALAANTNFDVFLYDSAGTLTLESVAWTNATTRATAITTQDGVPVKTGATGRRYLCTFRTTGTIGQTEDSLAKRYLYNEFNKVPRLLRLFETTDTWTYGTATLRQARATATNQVELVVGGTDTALDLGLLVSATSANSGATMHVAIGEDSTTAAATTSAHATASQDGSGAATVNAMARFLGFVPLGYHYYAWLEAVTGGATYTFYGDNGGPGALTPQSGLYGMVSQ